MNDYFFLLLYLLYFRKSRTHPDVSLSGISAVCLFVHTACFLSAAHTIPPMGFFVAGKKFSLSENANLGPPEPAPELPCVERSETHGSEGAGGVLRVLQSSGMVQGLGFRAY